MSNARQGWNAAQLASERRPVNRKALAPVGEWMSAVSVRYHEGSEYHNATCKDCGYHVCSCCPEAALVPEPIRRGVHVPYFGWTRPAEPALLTYDQAVAACRAGAVLQVTGGVQEDAEEWVGTCIRFAADLNYFQTNLGGYWGPCRLEDNGIQFRICP